MEQFRGVLSIITTIIQGISILILVVGVAICVKRFLVSVVSKKKDQVLERQILKIKIELGRYILLGLEVLIVADILESILNPSWEDILMLATIVAIRTVISFFLNMEIRETNEEVEESAKLEKKTGNHS